eukprot:CAMPEP_0183337804 /NCGR_PEP_ID=MMETSP0164_2-20130417/5323_1 /TAXON_ID=221442 /ORGANISM="Coccolithus pelagicus ssp braarudi, Strain PLY182g" /LENGTH=335 /DNA_ID=CAMNT_0025507557 /DNA_START=13 /DNA_END=1020 /DNA_ORIENTATION=+
MHGERRLCPVGLLPPSITQLGIQWIPPAQLMHAARVSLHSPAPKAAASSWSRLGQRSDSGRASGGSSNGVHVGASQLDSCTNLAIAGTGSLSLLEALKSASPLHPSDKFRWHHMHDQRIGHVAPSATELPRSGKKRGYTCFIMSIRDPAARLESGFRWSLQGVKLVPFGHELDRSFSGEPYTLRSVSAFVRAFANASDVAHHAVMRSYLSSVAHPYTAKTRRSYSLGVAWGSQFLVSQLDYLRGFDPSTMSLHILCAERFEADWQQLLRRFGLSEVPLPHANDRLARVHGKAAHNGTYEDQFSLIPKLARFVRNCLYPWDTHLHRALCGAPAQPR